MNLNDEQQHILSEVSNLLVSKTSFVATLSGCAGSGKTTLCRYILHAAQALNYSVVGVAPTHKAKKVLYKSLNHKSFMNRTVQCATVASLLSKMRAHSYIGTKWYERSGPNKMANIDFFIVDEVSMICDDDTRELIEYVTSHDKRLLFVGDSAQIPNPQQDLVQNDDNTYSKADSMAFSLDKHYSLKTIMRQGSGNPLVDIYDYIRTNINSPLSIDRTSQVDMRNMNGVLFTTSPSEFDKEIVRVFTTPDIDLSANKIVCYTNESVRYYNRMVRNSLNRNDQLQPGWILMGYENTGWPEPYIANGQDYYIIKATPTSSKTIMGTDTYYSNIVGTDVVLQETDSKTRVTIFFPSTSHENNYEMMWELVKLAKKVNARGSRKDDFKNYRAFKDQIFFTETIYCLDTNEIINETDINERHPLLTHFTLDVLNEDGSLKSNKIVERVQSKYPFIIQQRMRDRKPITSVERLYDRFQIVSKDLDDGVAITAHKSQGSTYDTVFINECDFDKITDTWDYTLDILEKRTKEKNQLLYVAYTRPRNDAVVLYSA